jgi:hypothetical protein
VSNLSNLDPPGGPKDAEMSPLAHADSADEPLLSSSFTWMFFAPFAIILALLATAYFGHGTFTEL